MTPRTKTYLKELKFWIWDSIVQEEGRKFFSNNSLVVTSRSRLNVLFYKYILFQLTLKMKIVIISINIENEDGYVVFYNLHV